MDETAKLCVKIYKYDYLIRGTDNYTEAMAEYFILLLSASSINFITLIDRLHRTNRKVLHKKAYGKNNHKHKPLNILSNKAVLLYLFDNYAVPIDCIIKYLMNPLRKTKLFGVIIKRYNINDKNECYKHIIKNVFFVSNNKFDPNNYYLKYIMKSCYVVDVITNTRCMLDYIKRNNINFCRYPTIGIYMKKYYTDPHHYNVSLRNAWIMACITI